MIKQHVGDITFEITELTPDRATGVMPVADGVLNPFGTVHAGAMVWFADTVATTLALGSEDVQPGHSGFPLALTLNVVLLGNRSDGVITATSEFVKRGRTIATVRTLVSGPDGRPLLELTSTHLYSR
jgi:uncharacterized protein (TIGR00369 family)